VLRDVGCVLGLTFHAAPLAPLLSALDDPLESLTCCPRQQVHLLTCTLTLHRCRTPLCPILPQASVCRRTDRWVGDVARLMLDAGILSPHVRLCVYMARPLRPPPTAWQRLKRAVTHWARMRFDKQARARARAIQQVMAA
jgi:hypothetical protein